MDVFGRGPRRGRSLRAALPVLLAAALAACAGRTPPPATPATSVEEGWSQVGEASWYGKKFHGRPTASGERFDMDAMTAAHRTLPLGTWIDVTNLENGRRAELRVTDRGPFAKGRILDVSRAAARRLGFLVDGTAKVKIVVTRPPSACREVQVASFSDPSNADAMLARLRDAGEPAREEPGPDGFTRVVAGPLRSDEAEDVARRFGGEVRACAAKSETEGP
ncbi:MAG TPA: septal ring lytic transglycosylase RlpA family protein [Gemmatimonadota bacterium]|nr:septal ring lytic transglycosylase RlpA family protein [Gemmatimonadota bacterium]